MTTPTVRIESGDSIRIPNNFADLGDGPFDLREMSTDDLKALRAEAAEAGDLDLVWNIDRIRWSRPAPGRFS